MAGGKWNVVASCGKHRVSYTFVVAVVSVEMWMDFGCPWSRMSFVELNRAVESRGDTLDVQFHGLRLDPVAPSDYGKTTIENLCDHLSISEAEAEAMLQKVVEAGQTVGVGFNFRTARGASTFDAHRLLRFSHIYGVQSELALVLWRAHFEDGQLVSDEDVLMACAAEAGLSADDASRVLRSDEYGDEVTTGEKAAADQGIQQTPYFVFSTGAVLSGMQYVADFDIVLR